MRNSIELFELHSSRLVYTDGMSEVSRVTTPDDDADYLAVRRYGRGIPPRAQIVTFVFSEFLSWRLQGIPLHSAFTDLAPRTREFLTSQE